MLVDNATRLLSSLTSRAIAAEVANGRRRMGPLSASERESVDEAPACIHVAVGGRSGAVLPAFRAFAKLAAARGFEVVVTDVSTLESGRDAWLEVGVHYSLSSAGARSVVRAMIDQVPGAADVLTVV